MQDIRLPLFDSSLGSGISDQFHIGPFWKRRHLEFLALCRLVELESAELAARVRLDLASRSLTTADEECAPVFRSPSFVLWVSVLRDLVTRNTHRSLPTGHMEDHLADLHRFAFAAACLKNDAYECCLRTAQDGRLFLPGVGLILVTDRDYSGEIVRLETDGEALLATLELGHWRLDHRGTEIGTIPSEAAAGWRRVHRLGWGISLDNSAEMYRAHRAGNPTWTVQSLTHDKVMAWANLVGDACRLISSVEEKLWVPVRALVSSIFPLESPPDRSLSGTAPEAFGCIAASLPPGAPLLAESLTHEAAHTAFHVLLDERKFWDRNDAGQLYRSPWRHDLRPIWGMLHGVFAFLAVSELWALLLGGRALEGDLEETGRSRLRTVALQVREALTEVADSPELTDTGRAFLAKAGHRIAELVELSRYYAAAATVENAIQVRLREHRAGLPEPERIVNGESISTADQNWTRELGTRMPPPVNHRSGKILRRETISDSVQLAAFKAEPAVDRLEDLALRTSESAPQSSTLVRGSISYGRGDFSQAVKFYSEYVELRWDDFDAWRLLASALRRAGRFRDATAIAFNLDLIIDGSSPSDLRQRWGRDWPFHLDGLTQSGTLIHEGSPRNSDAG